MNDDYVNLYSDAQRDDLVMGAYARGDQLNFYRRQVARYSEPVLELAWGSGRLTIPLAKERINIMGTDISEEMLHLAKWKTSKNEVNIRFLRGDMRNFDLGEKFKFIFILAQSLSHLHRRFRRPSKPRRSGMGCWIIYPLCGRRSRQSNS
jgi:hypothetical protein